MRFAFAHKLCSYLTVGCAFLALVLSGEFSLPVVILAALGILGSWFWEPPRISYERFAIPWTVLSSLILAYTVFMAFTGGDLVLLGGDFLLYLLVAKLCNRRACKDYLHVYVITFLMLVAGTVLNSEFTYGVFFLGYVVSATWALILFHLRREMEDNFLLKHMDGRASERIEVTRILSSRRIVGRPFFIGTSLVSLSIFAVAAILFLSIPRIGFGLFFQKSRGGLTMTGFSDGVELGGHGTIKTDTRVVMRVEVDDSYEGRMAPYIHWRGVAFDQYKRAQWTRSRNAPKTARTLTAPEPGKERHYLLYDQGIMPTDVLRERAEAGVRQRIYLEPIGFDVLFGASMPLAFEFDAQLGRRSARTERNDELRFVHAAGVRYEVFSDIGAPDSDVLRAARGDRPKNYDRYLQVPEEVTPEVRALALEITRGAVTDYDKAVAVETWLKENLSYTLEMRSPGDVEPIHFFLFERKQGHCEYFSSAMAILLRIAGVPTRNVNGFLGGEWNEYESYIAVRAGDAHSWVEVYFPGHGWVTFDPTPSAEVDRLGRGGDSIGERLRRLMDTVRFKWFKWVIEYDLYRQVSLFRTLRQSLGGGARSVKGAFSGLNDWLKRHKALLGSLVALVFLGLVAFQLVRRRRGRTVQRRREREPMSAFYNQVLDRLAKRGHRRGPSVTPREHARALAEQGMPGAAAFAELTELYYEAEYGAQVAPETLSRARDLSAAMDREFAEARQQAKKRAAS